MHPVRHPQATAFQLDRSFVFTRHQARFLALAFEAVVPIFRRSLPAAHAPEPAPLAPRGGRARPRAQGA